MYLKQLMIISCVIAVDESYSTNSYIYILLIHIYSNLYVIKKYSIILVIIIIL